jgi:hypothetical protein
MPGTNTLAYLAHSSATKEKGFIILTLGSLETVTFSIPARTELFFNEETERLFKEIKTMIQQKKIFFSISVFK